MEQIESFIANIPASQEPQKLVDTANQIVELSITESIPLDKIHDHFKREEDQVQRIKEEIQKASPILKQKNIDIQTIDEYKNLKEEVSRCNYHVN